MFKTPDVETYLQDSYPSMDGDHRLMVLRCYVNPISRERVAEVSEDMADVLFRKIGKDWVPRGVLQKCNFGHTPPPHALSFCRHADYRGARIF